MDTKLVFVFVVLAVALVAASPVEEEPFDCPANEQYYKCNLEVCYKNCRDLKMPPPCPAIAAGCYHPGCECVAGYLRNSAGVCVPTDECS
ncbi:venom serine protease inhibitor-like [Aricia agestis]|uniref:venom serine protease inhibitor-like n=1 Tax=Aricia agestis TaxID=91739 RepID=UPI001C204C47|nr:venom serine protease inhibitor-like [Aricia agestis]